MHDSVLMLERENASRQARLTGAAAAAALLGLLAVAAFTLVPGTSAGPKKGGDRPNIVVVMTDDQTLESMRVMSRVNSRIGDRGVVFENSFVNYPLCCPSRATFLTGQYARNHGVLDNAPPQGGFVRLRGNETLPIWLQRAGYYTGQVGKYLNGYGDEDPNLVPPGWSEWFAPTARTVDDVYDYEMNQDGALIQYGHELGDYKQDVISERAVDFISRNAPAPRPFFLFVGYTAPHAAGPNPNPMGPEACAGFTPKPALRHAGLFASEQLPQKPSFNEPDVSDKPTDIQDRELFDTGTVEYLGRSYRCTLEELQSVDEGVGHILDALDAAGELDDTVVMYMSDNGLFFGEHRIAQGKKRVYEEAIRVPLMIRGPGFERGLEVQDLVINADVAPTILELAGARAGLTVDGQSLLPLLKHPDELSGRELLIESNRFVAIRTWRYVYAENADGTVEFYDLLEDPFQLRSVHGDARYREARIQLANRLQKLRKCEGPRCRKTPKAKLALDYHDGEDGPRSCATPPVRAQVLRKRENVSSVSFSVNGGRARERDRAPFRDQLPFRELRRQRTAVVTATVDFVDGRRMTLTERLRPCR
jgi:arylsulfatase A-like enzyme